MTGKPLTNVAASVRQRLLNLSREKGADYNALLAQYGIERFLFRLSKSPLANQFVLKGAMLFRVWAADLHRPTKDLDLLGIGDNTPAAVSIAVRQIIAVEVTDDGLRFDPTSVAAAEIREEQQYAGVRVKLTARLGNARIPMQIDVGFGDSVVPAARRAAFPTLLAQEAPRVRMYPPETVVAEKLEAIATLGFANSRMKDYYDIWVLLQIYQFDSKILARAIGATFRRRGTPMPRRQPIGLSDEFGQDLVARQRWNEFLARLQLTDVPREFHIVLAAIRRRIAPAMRLARV